MSATTARSLLLLAHCYTGRAIRTRNDRFSQSRTGNFLCRIASAPFSDPGPQRENATSLVRIYPSAASLETPLKACNWLKECPATWETIVFSCMTAATRLRNSIGRCLARSMWFALTGRTGEWIVGFYLLWPLTPLPPSKKPAESSWAVLHPV